MAIRIDSSGEYLSRAADIPDEDVFTIVGWVYVTANVGAVPQSVFWFDSGNDFSTQHNNLQLMIYNGSTTINGSTLSTGLWYHMAMVGDAGALRLYLNGVLDVDTTTAESNPTGLRVGNNAFSRYLSGRFAAIKMWDAVLTQAEIVQEMYQYCPIRTTNINLFWPLLYHTDVVDYSGAGRNATVTGTLSTEDGPPIPWRCQNSKIFIPVSIVPPSTRIKDMVGFDFVPSRR